MFRRFRRPFFRGGDKSYKRSDYKVIAGPYFYVTNFDYRLSNLYECYLRIVYIYYDNEL